MYLRRQTQNAHIYKLNDQMQEVMAECLISDRNANKRKERTKVRNKRNYQCDFLQKRKHKENEKEREEADAPIINNN